MKQSFVDSPVYVSKSDTIIDAVSAAFGFPREELLSERRRPAVVGARHALFMLLREKTPLSLPAIGRICGRDHTTVMYGLERAAARMSEDGFKERVERARATLGEM